MALSPLSLDHVALWVADRDRIAAFAIDHLGMHEIERTDDFTLVGADARRFKLTLFAGEGPRDGAMRVGVAGAYLELLQGERVEPERPLLNHVAVLVESADDLRDEAVEAGAEVVDVKDAANTYAVFVNGPDGVKLEYVEHKPSFSLA